MSVADHSRDDRALQGFVFESKPDADGVYAVSLPAGVVEDSLGNKNSATDFLSVVYGVFHGATFSSASLSALPSFRRHGT